MKKLTEVEAHIHCPICKASILREICRLPWNCFRGVVQVFQCSDCYNVFRLNEYRSLFRRQFAKAWI